MDEGQQLKVMAIVGFGGLGKTTLAKEVSREVGGKFDCKAFVSVSQKPEMIGLFNSLLSQFGLSPDSHACQLQDPINRLRGHLQDKRYFIIVDDLWDNTKAWDSIQLAFPPNNHCSRVMITTRNESLARSCCGNQGCTYNMKPLSEQDSNKLFFDRIFGSEDACPSELKKASSEILKKCGGLPLAIITMASILANQSTRLEGQLEYIQNSLATKSATNSNYEDMMYILDLSYKNLPRHLKACFLYLGSYPEDHIINRVQLVRRWVAEGFVSNSVGQDVWDAAESYFNELINRSLIQAVYDEYVIEITGCRVHDLLLDLIIRRCKEDNFLCSVNDPREVVEVQDKIIRRLNVFGLQGPEDDEAAITTIGVNLAQIRSLSISSYSNWIFSLLEFKFVRVLSLDVSYRTRMAMDLTVINQLSQLRYLRVFGIGESIMLPCQIQGLKLLETLDLSGIYNCSISLEIVDAPRLSHLLFRWGTRMPDCIGKFKSLRTLRGFCLPMDSPESLVGLGQLTALSDLLLLFPKECASSSNATWMAALGSCLDNLSNLKQLSIHKHVESDVAFCGDALSSLSPPFRNLEKLYLQDGCTFSRVPRWIGQLHNLRELWFGAKQVLQEDIAIIGTRLPSLICLGLRIPGGVPMERILIQGSRGFPALKRFWFDCDGISFLTFEAGAMPALRELCLAFDAAEWDRVVPAGLQHLPSLEEITAWRAMYYGKLRGQKVTEGEYRKKEAEAAALIKSVFQEAADALPTRPAFVLESVLIFRPVEEEDHQWEVEEDY